jgi:DNA-binding response OmpR family regulator
MMEYRSVIVLQDARAVRDNLVQELARHDFAVRSCGSLAGFRHLYATQPSPLVVLTGDPDDLARNAHQARIAAPGAIIIALGMANNTSWRVHVMAAGADACHAASIDIVELVAILSSWWRHAGRNGDSGQSISGREGLAIPVVLNQGLPRDGDLPHVTSPADVESRHEAGKHSMPAVPMPAGHSSRLGSGWTLDANSRALLCPNDRALPLTLAESNFLMRLATSDGQLLRRHGAAGAVHADSQPDGQPDGRADTRGMDVVVSRLRRKAKEAGIELPLLAVRGCGYLFAEWLSILPSVAPPCAASFPARLPVSRLQAGRPFGVSAAQPYATVQPGTRGTSEASLPALCV